MEGRADAPSSRRGGGGSSDMITKLEMLRRANSMGTSVSTSQQHREYTAKTGLKFDLKGAIKAAEKAVHVDGNKKRRLEEMRGKIGGGGGGDADADADADASAGAGAGASEEKVDRVHMLPMDWSLKKKAVFTSTLPFECFQNSFTASPEFGHQALRSFTSGNRRSRDPCQMYLQSLFTWTFPLNPLQKQLHQKQQDEASRERYNMWREALRDLIYSTYTGLCCSFYIIPPKGSGDHFIALFCCKNVQGRNKVSASLSSSSEGMRSKLKEEYGLTFSEPLRNSISTEYVDEDKSSSGAPGFLANYQENSFLYFSGKENVHGLYDFLLNECGKVYHKGCDTPILVAPVPFEGASVKRYHPEYRNYKQNLSKKFFREGEDQGKFYQLILEEDVIPPWVIDRLCTTFRKTQQTGFDALFELDRRSKNFNMNVILLEEQDEEYDSLLKVTTEGYSGGFWDTEEQDKWFTHPRKLAGKCVKKVSSSKGVYTITSL